MNPRLAAVYEPTFRAREKVFAVVEQIPADIRGTAPAAGAWAVDDVLEHLRLTEEGTVRLLTRMLEKARAAGAPAGRPDEPPNVDDVITMRSGVTAPPVVAPGSVPAPSDVIQGLRTTRASFERLLAQASDSGLDLTAVRARHAVFGEIHFYQWVSFIGAHELHHLAQIERTVQGLSRSVSRFSNPASGAKDAGVEYRNALLELLGDRDPFEVWAELPDAIDRLVAGLAESDARRPERPGKWSILQILQHLCDSEVVYGYRVRLTVAEESPPILGYDQDRWATRLHYPEETLSDSIADLRTLRHRNLRFVRRLSDEELDRAGLHNERGPESVRLTIRMLAAHDLLHRRQIERVRRTLGV